MFTQASEATLAPRNHGRPKPSIEQMGGGISQHLNLQRMVEVRSQGRNDWLEVFGYTEKKKQSRIRVCCQSIRPTMCELESADIEMMVLLSWRSGWQKWKLDTDNH